MNKNRDKKVGLIGCGNISLTHLKAWQKTAGCAVEGVYDLNKEMAASVAKQFNIRKVYDSMESLLDECQVVDLCTPPETHREIIKKAAEKGCHILTEKPIVTELEDWQAIKHAVSEAGVKIAVIHNQKFSPDILYVKSLIAGGYIGDIIGIERFFLTSPKHDRMLMDANHWSLKLPGGRWFETLPHELYLLHYFAGALELSGVCAFRPDSSPHADVAVTLSNKQCWAKIFYSARCEIHKRLLVIYGTDGVIKIDGLGGTVTMEKVRDKKITRIIGRAFIDNFLSLFRIIPDRTSYIYKYLRGDMGHPRFFAAFSNHLHDLAESPTPIEEIDYVVSKSAAIGREIEKQINLG